jgi:hypothetical protein
VAALTAVLFGFIGACANAPTANEGSKRAQSDMVSKNVLFIYSPNILP